MRTLLSFGCALALVASVSVVRAEELKSGLQVGESIGAYDVEKCAGNANDGVEEGAKLCYRCKLGNRPVIAIFTRSTDESVSNLMKELDAVVAKNEEKKAASFVNLLGESPEKMKAGAKKLVDKSKAENIAVVVPVDGDNGPEALNLNPKADVTVLIYNKGKIEANHAIAAGKLDKKAIQAIIADTDKILK